MGWKSRGARAAGGRRVHMPSPAADKTRLEKHAPAEHERATAGARSTSAQPQHAAAPRARAWMGGRRVLRAGRVPATTRGGAFQPPRTASPATRPLAAPPTRRATPTLARGLVRASMCARSPPRGSGWGTSRPTLDVRLPHDRFEGGAGLAPTGTKEI